MRFMRRLRSASLLVRFGVLGLVLTLALGLALASVLTHTITQRGLQQATWTAIVTARLGVQSQVTPGELANGFDPQRLDKVTAAVHAAQGHLQDGRPLADLDPVEINVFNMGRTMVYSDDRSAIGTTEHSAELDRALRGTVVSGFATSLHDADKNAGNERFLEIFVPMQYEGVSAPEGVVELYLPYAPVASTINADVRTLIITLVSSLAVFYAVMFRFVAAASRRLDRQTRDLRRSADRNRHQATHDALTGLPNRVLLRDRLGQALAAAEHSDTEVAVLLIDLDRFKEINDALGHSCGDQLLCQVGPRLRSMLRDGDTVARLGGDEFAVLLPVVEDAAEASAVAQRLREALHRPFNVSSNGGPGHDLDVEASIGIAISPRHGTDAEELLRNADIAMYAAKELKGGAVVFRPEEHATATTRLSVLGDLRRALDRDDELMLHYQPKYTLEGERLEGAEALLRWRHPERGLIAPGDFIPVAEGTGIILPLTERVFDLALRQLRAWLDAGCAVPVAVNLSTRCLLDASLPDMVVRMLATHVVPARLLRLEVTESAVMGDAARCLEVLQRLRRLGLRMSIDDFGTGYSSMAYLRRMPVDELKIDRSFVLGMTATQQDAVLVRTAVDLGHNLGLTVVAEGVEQPAQVTALRQLGCDLAQGFHFGRPMPAERFTELLLPSSGVHQASEQAPEHASEHGIPA